MKRAQKITSVVFLAFIKNQNQNQKKEKGNLRKERESASASAIFAIFVSVCRAFRGKEKNEEGCY